MTWLRWIKNFIGWVFGPLFIIMTLGIITVVFVWAHYTSDLPSEEELRANVGLQLPLRVYSKDRKLIAEFGQYRRRPVKNEAIPEQLKNAFISIEDSRFYEHKGIDFYGVARAVVSALKNRSASQGASTITMQVARNFFLTRKKTIDRKLKEVFLAQRLEQIFTKDEILELYLNKIFLGNRSYGIGSAAEVYYGKTVDDLSLAQMAMIAGLPKAPSAYNPIINPERAKERRDYILQRMAELGFTTKVQSEIAIKEPLTAKIHARAKTETEAPYVAEMVRQEVIKRFGEELVYRTGMNVYTTIDDSEQAHAIKTLREHLIKYDRRHGYRGPEDHLELAEYAEIQLLQKKLVSYKELGGLIPAVVLEVSKEKAKLLTAGLEQVEMTLEDFAWARRYINENRRGKKPTDIAELFKIGDVIRLSKNDEAGAKWTFTPLPDISGAIVSINPENGALLSVVGGFDFNQTKFNRATQAQRQPGSSFKPFVYSAALAKNYSPASVVNDAPLNIPGSKWDPQNYSNKFYGPTRLRKGLKKSRNLVSIQLLREIGIDYAMQYVDKFGFTESQVPRDLTMALGTGSVTPVQLAGAYSTFANGGFKVEPYFISHITDNEGDVIFNHLPLAACEDGCDQTVVRPAERIMKPYVRYEISSMLRSVAVSGTAARTRVLGRKDIAGKTGTTNDQKDAWFAGFTPKKVAIVWMGFDQIKPMGKRETATGLALPTWIDFMKVALKDVPEEVIKPVKGMVTVNIDGMTGFRADRQSTEIVSETLMPEQVPNYVPRDFLYSGGESDENNDGIPDILIRVNNPVSPTIAIVDDLMMEAAILASGENQQQGGQPINIPGGQGSAPATRTIVIDNERFEIPEQLF